MEMVILVTATVCYWLVQQINKLETWGYYSISSKRELLFHNLAVEVAFWTSDAIEKKNQHMHTGRSHLSCLHNTRHNSAQFCISIWYDIPLFAVSVIVLVQDLVLLCCSQTESGMNLIYGLAGDQITSTGQPVDCSCRASILFYHKLSVWWTT